MSKREETVSHVLRETLKQRGTDHLYDVARGSGVDYNKLWRFLTHEPPADDIVDRDRQAATLATSPTRETAALVDMGESRGAVFCCALLTRAGAGERYVWMDNTERPAPRRFKKRETVARCEKRKFTLAVLPRGS